MIAVADLQGTALKLGSGLGKERTEKLRNRPVRE